MIFIRDPRHKVGAWSQLKEISFGTSKHWLKLIPVFIRFKRIAVGFTVYFAINGKSSWGLASHMSLLYRWLYTSRIHFNAAWNSEHRMRVFEHAGLCRYLWLVSYIVSSCFTSNKFCGPTVWDIIIIINAHGKVDITPAACKRESIVLSECLYLWVSCRLLIIRWQCNRSDKCLNFDRQDAPVSLSTSSEAMQQIN